MNNCSALKPTNQDKFTAYIVNSTFCLSQFQMIILFQIVDVLYAYRSSRKETIIEKYTINIRVVNRYLSE